MLMKKEGSKLKLTKRELSKVYGGCGQTCNLSCPDVAIHKDYYDFHNAYDKWRVTPYPTIS